MKNLFIAATGQDRGKTSFSVGMISALREHTGSIGYMKPVGHRFITTQDGLRIDEDAQLIDTIYGFGDNLKDVSPIIVDSGFTRHCIQHSCEREVEEQLSLAYERVKTGRDLVVIEGSGKCSVGEVIKLSNARVAELLDAKVILVAQGGFGSTIDTVMLNMAFLQKFDIDILGVVINKVFKKKYDEVKEITSQGLRERGVNVLGVLPYERLLTYPTLEHIVAECPEFKPLTQASKTVMHRNISRIFVGAMTPHEALKYLKGRELIITGGDREDIIVSALARSAIHVQSGRGGSVSGIIVTGGLKPHDSLLETAENLGILIMQAEEDTYSVASRVKGMTVKLRPNDRRKIDKIQELVKTYLNIDEIVESLK